MWCFLEHIREGKGYIAVPAYGDSLAEAKKTCCTAWGCRAKQMLELSTQLVWAPISMMPLGFHSKVVTGKA
eukprot:1157031-Pelagomonas_calceolata.AAC.5